LGQSSGSIGIVDVLFAVAAGQGPACRILRGGHLLINAKALWRSVFFEFCISCICARRRKSFRCMAIEFVESRETRFGDAKTPSSGWAESRKRWAVMRFREFEIGIV